jgi:hypothetical protein
MQISLRFSGSVALEDTLPEVHQAARIKSFKLQRGNLTAVKEALGGRFICLSRCEGG